VASLVNNSTGSETLTLRLGSNDTYSIESEAGITSTQGQSISFYSGVVSAANLIATVNFEYA
jgi:hypothetical protein